MARDKKDRVALVALIVAVLALPAAWLVVPEFRKWTGLDRPEHGNNAVKNSISGIVVDRDTNHGIAQASIVLVGRPEQSVSEDSGNFNIDLPPDVLERLRLRVSKNGFEPLDTSIEPPADNLVLQLHRQ